MKYRINSCELQRSHSEDLGVVISLDKLGTTDSQLAMARAHLMVLHPPGSIGRSGKHHRKLKLDGGGDVLHIDAFSAKEA